MTLVLGQVIACGVVDSSPGALHRRWIERAGAQRLHMHVILFVVVRNQRGHHRSLRERRHAWGHASVARGPFDLQRLESLRRHEIGQVLAMVEDLNARRLLITFEQLLLLLLFRVGSLFRLLQAAVQVKCGIIASSWRLSVRVAGVVLGN